MPARLNERLTGAMGAALIVGLLACVLLFGLSVGLRVRPELPIAALTLRPPRADPPPPPPSPHKAAHKPSRWTGRVSAPARRASPMVAPVPSLVPVLPVLPAVELADRGVSRATGPAERDGTGSGMGGEGDGGGGSGDGAGGGDDGDVPPRQIKGHLSNADLPQQMRDDRVQGTVGVRYEVLDTGRVRDCIITASSGTPALDGLTCSLIEQRFRFRPSRDRDGHVIPATIEEEHRWHVEDAPLPPGE